MNKLRLINSHTSANRGGSAGKYFVPSVWINLIEIVCEDSCRTSSSWLGMIEKGTWQKFLLDIYHRQTSNNEILMIMVTNDSLNLHNELSESRECVDPRWHRDISFNVHIEIE
jgi:hypothetical protein